MYLSVPVKSIKVTRRSGHVNVKRFLPPYPVNVYCVALVSPGYGWKAATHRRAAHCSLWCIFNLSPMPGLTYNTVEWVLVPERPCRDAARAVCIDLFTHVVTLATTVFTSVDSLSHMVPTKIAEDLLNQYLNTVGLISLLFAFCKVLLLIGVKLHLSNLLSMSMHSSSNDVSSLKGMSDHFHFNALQLVSEVELDMLV
jgi:hypothetical protein